VPGSRIDAEAKRFADDLERRLAPLDRRILTLEWQQLVGRGGDDAPVQARRHRLLAPSNVLARIRTYRALRLDGPVGRRLEILERAALQARVEQDPEIVRRRSQLERRIGSYRPTWHGRRVGRSAIFGELRTNPERAERERAYRAEVPLYRPMEAPLRRLARLRNDRARALGFSSFPEYRLRLEGLTVPRFGQLAEGALRYARTEARRLRDAFQDRTGEGAWYPWDFAYAVGLEGGFPDDLFPGDALLGEVVAAVRKWGFSPSALRFRVDRHDMAYGGMCLAPDPPRDVRIVVHPAGGYVYCGALFHEVGHAVASRSVRQPTHLLRWHEHLPGFAGLSEGEGVFFEQISANRAWLRGRGRGEPAALERLVDLSARAPVGRMAFLVSSVLPEIAMYERPTKDPQAMRVRWFRRIFDFDEFEPNSFAGIFPVQMPIYSVSYVLAGLVSPALSAAVLHEVGGDLWPNSRVGPWLVDRWFRDGSSYDWWTRLREVTGQPLGTGPFNARAREAVG
jgi:hypothetical protein